MATPTWSQRISAFLLSPSQFLSSITSDSFLAELLHELRDDKASDNTKVTLCELLTSVRPVKLHISLPDIICHKI